MKKIRIVLIEDNRLLRDGIVSMINGQRDMRVVAGSAWYDSVLLKSRADRARIILVDLGLRNQNGLRVVASIRKATPELKVIGMGLIPAQSDIVEFVEAGASGFILKDATVEEFLETIRSVARGEKVLPSLLTHSLFSHVVELALKNGKRSLNNAVRMTKREREVIALIADGLSNKEIAQRLNIATYTVKSHVHNIMEKLALHTRLQVANYTRNVTASLS